MSTLGAGHIHTGPSYLLHICHVLLQSIHLLCGGWLLVQGQHDVFIPVDVTAPAVSTIHTLVSVMVAETIEWLLPAVG